MPSIPMAAGFFTLIDCRSDGLVGAMALSAGLAVLTSTRQLELAQIFLGVAFIVALMGLAMLSLAAQPAGEENFDLREQGREQQDRAGDGPRGH